MSVRFDGFELDESRRQLLGAGVEIHLQPKAWTLLKLLIDRRPAAVSRQEIYDHLWPGTFVSDVNIATLVANLRESLEDDAHQPRFIRTVHGFGYSFCGEVVDEKAHAPRAAVASLLIGTRVVALTEGETVIGRDASLPSAIDDTTVSRRHAVILCTGSTAIVQDCGSKNGTFVGGQRIEASFDLRDGDVVTFGSVNATFTRKTAPTSTQTIVREAGS